MPKVTVVAKDAVVKADAAARTAKEAEHRARSAEVRAEEMAKHLEESKKMLASLQAALADQEKRHQAHTEELKQMFGQFMEVANKKLADLAETPANG